MALISNDNANATVVQSLPRGTDHAGVRKLFHLVGADVSRIDMGCIASLDGGIGLDDLCALSLMLSVRPELVSRRLAEVALDAAYFAFECADGSLRIFVPGPYGALTCLDPDTGLAIRPPAPDTLGRALLLPSSPEVPEERSPLMTWLKVTRDAASGTMLPLVILTVISNVLGLSLPLFTLAVYDQVLASGDRFLLGALTVGIVIALLCDFCLRGLRSTILARTSSLIDLNAKSNLVGRLLRSPELVGIGTSARTGMARLKDLDRVRTFFVGPIGVACLEAPFVLFYVLALGYLVGWLALLPAGVLLLGGVCVLLLLSPVLRRARGVGRQSDEYGITCYEVATGFEAIKSEGETAWWLNRFRDASARLAEVELLRQRALQGSQIASGTVTSLAVLATLGAGAALVIDDGLSVGALIASVALVWRMSAPLPSLMQGYLRRDEIRRAIANSAAVLGSELSASRDSRLGGGSGGANGRVVFASVMMSYERGRVSALRNVSFEINPGEIVAITGHAGAGKSTLLDLVAGMAEPQLGAVTIDGVNPRQISHSALRQSIGYLVRDHRTLPVTVAEFLDLGVEIESRAMRNHVCDKLGVYELVENLPAGFDTLMSDLDPNSGLVGGLALARVLLLDTSLLLLDEPDASSPAARQALLRVIEESRGARTVILVTHSPEFIASVDRVLVLNQGSVVRNCAPSEMVRKSKADER